VAWHGAESGNVYLGSMRVNELGSGDCTLRRDEMELGDWDLEFLHLSSCQSMTTTSGPRGGRPSAGRTRSTASTADVDRLGLVGDYGDFADDAFDTTIADAWLDNMYRPDISGSDDQCPVAYAVGANSADTWSRIGSERYNHVLSDRRTSVTGVVFIGGCDPAAETVINTNTSN